jgi:hypothetical protein
MYGKIFESMYEGTLYGQWEAIVTMQQLIVIANEDGVVDMTPPHISGKTSIPLDIIEKGLEILSAPDKYSRTPGSDGTRIALLDDHRPWGWYIVNYKKYRDMVRREDKKEADRIRMANKRNANKINDVADSRIESHDVAKVAHTDTYTYTDTDLKAKGRASSSDFEKFWQRYPKKVKKKTAKDIWMRKKPDLDTLLADIENRTSNDSQWQDGFIPHPTTYLNGERWNDDIQVSKVDRGRKLTYAEQLAQDMAAKGMLNVTDQ